MKNRAHMEPRKQRIRRFQERPPSESIETLLNSIDNYFNNEIKIASDEFLTSLLFLGVHAAALTISEVFFGKKGLRGYKLFLETFVDGETPDTKFSEIAELIHDWRNVLAHQWLSSSGYKIGYDYKMSQGQQNRDGITFINPRIYCKYYLKAFSPTAKIWNYEGIFTQQELERIKNRIIDKFLKN